jgi:hypothetical protein
MYVAPLRAPTFLHASGSTWGASPTAHLPWPARLCVCGAGHKDAYTVVTLWVMWGREVEALGGRLLKKATATVELLVALPTHSAHPAIARATVPIVTPGVRVRRTKRNCRGDTDTYPCTHLSVCGGVCQGARFCAARGVHSA